MEQAQKEETNERSDEMDEAGGDDDGRADGEGNDADAVDGE